MPDTDRDDPFALMAEALKRTLETVILPRVRWRIVGMGMGKGPKAGQFALFLQAVGFDGPSLPDDYIGPDSGTCVGAEAPMHAFLVKWFAAGRPLVGLQALGDGASYDNPHPTLTPVVMREADAEAPPFRIPENMPPDLAEAARLSPGCHEPGSNVIPFPGSRTLH